MGAIAAAVLPAAISAGASIIGGHAASKAANAQSNAAQQGIDETRTDLQPWLSAGQSSLGAMLDLLGLNGSDKQQSAITGLQGSPLFTSLYGQGKDAILQSAAATGGLRGGNTEHSLFDLGSNLLAQVIQQQMANLGGLSSEGLQAGGYVSSAISNLLGQKGAAQAGGIIGGAQGITGALGGLGSLLGSPSVLNGIGSIFGGGSGGIPLPDLSAVAPVTGLDAPVLTSLPGGF